MENWKNRPEIGRTRRHSYPRAVELDIKERLTNTSQDIFESILSSSIFFSSETS
ncbi:MAG: hypothetical protein HQK59_05035 [Deltaproteobacteria bacterium]|nr:hypothetical protein [Deltaproteobacteria bacterium]